MSDDRANADAAPESGPPRRSRFKRAHLWVSSTYFAEGYPYSLVNNLADILFKELGASLQIVGLTSLFHLPWNLKFLWGPFVDSYESKRRWLLATEVAITVVITIIGLLIASASSSLIPLAAGFMVLALLSATHDIAIDGFYLEALDEQDQSTFVGYRAAAYRIAMLAVSGPLIAICARFGWTAGLLGAAALMLALTQLHAWALPRSETPKKPWTVLAKLASWRSLPFLAIAAVMVALESWWAVGDALSARGRALVEAAPWVATIGVGGWIGLSLLAALLILLAMLPLLHRRMSAARERGQLSDYAGSFISFLEQPKFGLMLAFVILFRTGESFLQKMRWPFFDDVVGLDLEVYGIAHGTIGMIASFTATIIGGRLIARDGLRRWIWPFMLAQNVLNLLYMGLAMVAEPGSVSTLALTAIIAAEHLGAGFGTAVFMVYLMRTCDPAHKAGHFAIVSALMSVSFTLAGVLSGFLAELLGFTVYFGFTFLATIPAMALIPFIPHLDGRRA